MKKGLFVLVFALTLVMLSASLPIVLVFGTPPTGSAADEWYYRYVMLFLVFTARKEKVQRWDSLA